MKELSTEEKAKRYDKVLEKAEALYKAAEPMSGCNVIIETLFPELKESEDEKIRKELIFYLRYQHSISENFEDICKWIAWLEKQGEKLPVGFYYVNSEGKKFYSDTFKYGDVILHVEKQNEKKPSDHENQETKNGHKFNIGDIISNGNVEFRVDNIVKNCIGQDCYFLVNIESEKKGTRYYVLYDSKGKTYNSGEVTWLCEQVDKSFEKQGEQKPEGKTALEAAKEEKVDNQNCVKHADKIEPKFNVGDWITNGDYTWKIVEVKPLDYILQSQEGNIVDDTISHVDEQFHPFTIEEPQNMWKPSDEQMEALEHFVRSIGESGYASPYDNNTKLLYSLLSDLKKLKE